MRVDTDIPVAIFGGIFQGDPIDVHGQSQNPVTETLYPPLQALAEYFDLDAGWLYDRLVRDGRLTFLVNGRLVVATHAYTHDNNTTRTRQ